jgi:hypothetical protein
MAITRTWPQITCSGDCQLALSYLQSSGISVPPEIGGSGRSSPMWTPEQDRLLMQQSGRRPTEAGPEPFQRIVSCYGQEAVRARQAWLRTHMLT